MTYRPDWKWRPISLPAPLSARATEKVQRVLDSWENTPYAAGHQMRGVGCDCVRFVCAVLDELYGIDRVQHVVTLPPDAALHTRAGAIASMKKIRELYMPNDSIEDGSLEPGDVAVVGPKDGGPGHAMIVGARPNELWHSSNVAGRVVRTGLNFHKDEGIFGVYRCSTRESWAVS